MRFGPETTTDEVLAGVDLAGKFAVVTGGTSGLGLETCRALAAAGAEVLLTARNEARGAEIVAKIHANAPGSRISYGILELDDLASVRQFAGVVQRTHTSIDLLINNAGVMATPFRRTKDGFESQLGTNHLGHYLLTRLLLPELLKAAPSRIVNLSSAGHHFSDMHWGDLNFERHEYDKWQAYGQSKTANILFALELDRRLSSFGINAYAVHPGAVRTGLSQHFTAEDRSEINRMMAEAKRELLMKSIPAGAASTVWAATAPQLAGHGGVYVEDCHIAGECAGFEGQAPWACDRNAARKLWNISEDLVAQTSSLLERNE